jgi:hypothetical protein
MRLRLLGLIPLALTLVLLQSPARADLVPMSGQGAASMANGSPEACDAAARKDAFRDAAEKLLRRLASGPVSTVDADAILADPGSLVRGASDAAKSRDGDICRVSVDVNIDDRRLKQAMERHFAGRAEATARQRSPVAIALRYVVNNALAADAEYASNEFQRRLAAQSVEVQVIGGSIHTSFEKKQFVPRYSIDSGPVAVNESAAQAIDRVRDRLWQQMREDVSDMVKVGAVPLRNIDILAAGEIQVIDKGPNPSGSGHIAGAFGTVKVQRMRGDDVGSASSDEVNVVGVDRSDAIRTATQRAVAQLADRVTGRLRASFAMDDQQGKSLTLNLIGGAYSHDVFPFVSALETAGAKIVEPGVVRGQGDAHKVNVLFPGGSRALQHFIHKYIRDQGLRNAAFNIVKDDEISFCMKSGRDCS